MNINEFLELSPNNPEIASGFAKSKQHLERCEKALCSISGGRDSDHLIDMMVKADDDNKVIYVFFNTGIEYEATKKHLKYLEEKYGVKIHEYKAKLPVPVACRKYGVPFLNKYVSEMIYRLQRHGFKWEDRPFEELYAEYPKCQVALQWWCNSKQSSMFNINRNKFLKEFLMENPPTFKISARCCHYAKKAPSHQAASELGCDLSIDGVRRAEGGVRSRLTSCFLEANSRDTAKFRPLFWFADEDRREYDIRFDIQHSECYTSYGLERTGCAGCPFGRDFEKELEIIRENEPKLYGAVYKIFGSSYEYRRKYHAFREEKERCNNGSK
jgi:3'-phosphoadenosine 5'-phosphosulfate sulfotransferase (PAPS reductase)/FAD synthetase